MALPDYIERVAVSSVLNRDSQQYGKIHLFDGRPDTCWNSDSGTPQWIMVDFKKPVKLTAVRIQFHGGFAAEEAVLQLWTKETKDNKTAYPIFPANVSSLQSFVFTDENAYTNACLLFRKATDFFGRIIVYRLDLSFD
ncbi:unnamed protein product [Mesocestoides corti]|uniref:F5/8 type C domain-containing protein n=1 Tax=Mesocestoides corti TaxID=53468 RepID=A0A0R3U743_MESCO|nr:unnamed protein product [Mesocestoides corti]